MGKFKQKAVEADNLFLPVIAREEAAREEESVLKLQMRPMSPPALLGQHHALMV